MNKDLLMPLRRLHGWLHDRIAFYRSKSDIKKIYLKRIKAQFAKQPESVILVFTPEHDNLGDHAIAYTENKMLNQLNIGYVEITSAQVEVLDKYNLLNIMNGYTILMNAGGYLGTLWFHVELSLRKIIKENPKSKIMMLPNTIYYENDKFGIEEFEKSISIYNSHPNLYICAREKSSYDIMSNSYKHVKLFPDVVMSLNEQTNEDRSGALICLRSDREKTRSDKDEMVILEQVKEIFNNRFTLTDMCADKAISIEEREYEVKKKFDQFKSAKLVITDRLHGMIFAAITGTPCIVINSKSPKVKGCYEWIKNLEYIRFADDVSDISKIYDTMPKDGNVYSNDHLKSYFEELMQDISNIVKGE